MELEVGLQKKKRKEKYSDDHRVKMWPQYIRIK